MLRAVESLVEVTVGQLFHQGVFARSSLFPSFMDLLWHLATATGFDFTYSSQSLVFRSLHRHI